MAKNYGWAEMPVMGYIEGSTNVRPIILECHRLNKSGILHYILNTRKSACEKASFLSSFLDLSNRKVLIDDPDTSDDKLLDTVMICDDCLKSTEWKDYKDGKERDINAEI